MSSILSFYSYKGGVGRTRHCLEKPPEPSLLQGANLIKTFILPKLEDIAAYGFVGIYCDPDEVVSIPPRSW